MSDTSTPMQHLTVLLLGSGGREHALAWKMAQSAMLERLVAAPGNPGIARHGECRSVDIEDGVAVLSLAREIGADLVVVGPEGPLAAGVADALRGDGIAVFGPSRGAARLEWDKAFSKDFMARHGIPTAASRTFGAEDLDDACAYVRSGALPVVIKANGLAAGKGVVIASDTEEALRAVRDMLSGQAFGDAGASIVVEEFMAGEEASLFAVCDGEHYVLLASSQDHKRVGDGDIGANTGGMGAYAPAPVVNHDVLERACREIIEPTLRGMAAEGNPYVGCLYAGLMIKDRAPRVVEFNSRFGDPETQVVLPLLGADLVALLHAAATGRLGEFGPVESRGTAVCVVLASSGYPGSYAKGMAIEGLDDAAVLPGVMVFHAGTRDDGDRIVSNGGRVLGVTAVGADGELEQTIARAYEAVARIAFEGAFHRTDIGRKGIAREAGAV